MKEYMFDDLSVYTAELTAIGLQWVEQVRPNKVVICSDSSVISIMRGQTEKIY